ncbi:hypothetical protein ACL02R_08430 [Streptomyces sp. MS19]|uniref:hypothetical protein n=1 Tax=Streptomyces sp. MS19 TaxID=3385972 RepID=UPI0039A0C7E3
MVMKAYSPEFKADAVALHLSDSGRTFEGIGKVPWSGRCPREETVPPDPLTSMPPRSNPDAGSS